MEFSNCLPIKCEISAQNISIKPEFHDDIKMAPDLFEAEYKVFTESTPVTISSDLGPSFLDCHLCTCKNIKRSQYENHMRTHTGERPFQCLHCPKRFARKGCLKTHTNTVHKTERPFKCPHCKASYTRKDVLKLHLRKHKGEKPFKCQICGKRFMDRNYLNRHQPVHSSEKRFECSDCGQQFRWENAMRSHYKPVHAGIKKEKWVCVFCEKPVACKVDHLRMHTREKPFICRDCGVEFACNKNLKRHRIKIHKKK